MESIVWSSHHSLRPFRRPKPIHRYRSCGNSRCRPATIHHSTIWQHHRHSNCLDSWAHFVAHDFASDRRQREASTFHCTRTEYHRRDNVYEKDAGLISIWSLCVTVRRREYDFHHLSFEHCQHAMVQNMLYNENKPCAMTKGRED